VTDGPESTAERTALWRALHVRLDRPPHVLTDEVGLRLLDPAPGRLDRPDMDPVFTRGMRASMVARARFVEEIVGAQNVGQYVILGAGLDTFAQRHPAAGVRVFEVDQPGPQGWKRGRLAELRLPEPVFVPADFEERDAWWPALVAAGFDPGRPAVVACTGVSMYLTPEAVAGTLRRLAALAPGSTLAMTFLVPARLLSDDVDRAGLEVATRGAAAAGTPFVSFFEPAEILGLARESGFARARHVSGADLSRRWFTGRPDGLRPSSGEDFLVAAT
jgi:methyltransferase (TIGR00027 family)